MTGKKRQIAYSRVLCPDGRLLRREVIVFGDDGSPQCHYPLPGELPFVEWRDETFELRVSIPRRKPED